jgi:2-polyprenyl-3-methyl-5-hydroxy-6-metoxy-1,4-benzoquinol methylase
MSGFYQSYLNTVLKVGCGSGIPNAAYLCEKGFHLTGIDVS